MQTTQIVILVKNGFLVWSMKLLKGRNAVCMPLSPTAVWILSGVTLVQSPFRFPHSYMTYNVKSPLDLWFRKMVKIPKYI